MFAYYLDLALRSLKRSPGLTLLMVLAIGFGVAASMTTWSVFRAVSGDPIPWKSSRLFVPQLDIWGPDSRKKGGYTDISDAFDYTDALALMRDHRGKLQSAMYQVSPSVVPADAAKHPINVSGHAVFSEFFPMVEAPFKYGSGWSAQDDQNRSHVLVLSDKLNQKLFGDVNSVGKSVNIEGKDYRVVGVVDRWNPQPRYYDVVNTGGFVGDGAEDVFLPFNTAIDVGMPNNGNTNCNEIPKEAGFIGLQHSSCVWIAYMVELDSATDVDSYKNYLDGYMRQQQQAGRFNWAPKYKLSDLPAWLDSEHVVPDDTKVSLLVALGLLIVCLVNTAGLLLAKFLRRSGEIGVRRALGAPRAAVYAQFLTEAGMVGAAGGVLGLLLTGVGVACVGWVLPKDIAALARLDVSLLAMTLVVAVIATVLAGLYPTWRASRVQPAWQLKSN
ncbi:MULTISPECIES: ABC transporter permease [Rhodanobacter]|uniref:ABC transporter permease n=1 Tax=Rhodanobacter hydrolyticus TaxID=2250595 RepID=A0ABW8J9H1_9GAMM|nr:ABC transporter permease [Rhodanobacter sp. 7MK24]MBD8880594.1 ABC transporter permease [Rhodanobacter sp. 7MK24]